MSISSGGNNSTGTSYTYRTVESDSDIMLGGSSTTYAVPAGASASFDDLMSGAGRNSSVLVNSAVGVRAGGSSGSGRTTVTSRSVRIEPVPTEIPAQPIIILPPQYAWTPRAANVVLSQNMRSASIESGGNAGATLYRYAMNPIVGGRASWLLTFSGAGQAVIGVGGETTDVTAVPGEGSNEGISFNDLTGAVYNNGVLDETVTTDRATTVQITVLQTSADTLQVTFLVNGTRTLGPYNWTMEGAVWVPFVWLADENISVGFNDDAGSFPLKDWGLRVRLLDYCDVSSYPEYTTIPTVLNQGPVTPAWIVSANNNDGDGVRAISEVQSGVSGSQGNCVALYDFFADSPTDSWIRLAGALFSFVTLPGTVRIRHKGSLSNSIPFCIGTEFATPTTFTGTWDWTETVVTIPLGVVFVNGYVTRGVASSFSPALPSGYPTPGNYGPDDYVYINYAEYIPD